MGFGEGGRFSKYYEYLEIVANKGACSLPGVTINYDMFMPVMWRAVQRGYVLHKNAVYVAHGLRFGFDLGAVRSKLFGRRVFKNYQSALDHADAVTPAIQKRVDQHRTLNFGTWDAAAKVWLDSTFGDYFIFPMGAVVKKYSTVWRPTDDHTRTGFNAATVLGILAHSINTYNEIAAYLNRGFCMHVSDVEDAFLLIPLAPWLWAFFLFRFFCSSKTQLDLLMHVCADFGTKGAPGTFKLLFLDVFLQMARSELVVTLPMPVYVDDCSLIGECKAYVAGEMRRFQIWAGPFGFYFKVLKDRSADNPQLVIGFWWDSMTFTRTLEAEKLRHYIDLLSEFASRKVLTLAERQSVAGKMQRAIMTLPPGAACLLSGVYHMVSSLSLRWHCKRTNRAERMDYAAVAEMLRLNMGRGYYRYDDFRRLGPIVSDACKGRYVGGGFVDSDGEYDFFTYGSAAARRPIDFLEGDTLTLAVERCGHKWYKCIKPFGLDNRVVERSASKMYSRVPRMDVLVRHLFVLQCKGNFILDPYWLSSEDNYLSDHLSRGREEHFLREVHSSGFLSPGSSVTRLEGAGRVRHIPEDVERLGIGSLLHPSGKGYSHSTDGDGPLGVISQFFVLNIQLLSFALTVRCFCGRPRRRPLRLRGGGPRRRSLPLDFTVPYSRATLYAGLPEELGGWLDNVLDNRLSESSMDTVSRARDIWFTVADNFSWAQVIQTDDPHRGAKSVAFVHHMATNTSLTFKSIENYVWGWRTWLKLQRQQDPVMGLMQWSDFMDSIQVITWVPSEPRSTVEHAIMVRYLQYLWDNPSFEHDQQGFYSVVLGESFSRAECPFPKSQDGRRGFNRSKHWEVGDFKFAQANGVVYLMVRFKGVKQDPLMTRLEARGTHGRNPDAGDWVKLGNTHDKLFSVVEWYKRFISHFDSPRDPLDPMFVDPRDFTLPLTYGQALAKVKAGFVAVGHGDPVGLHSFRIYGYYRSRRGNGTELTVAHGGWSAHGCHSRYDAFSLQEVLGIPSRMLGEFSVR